MDDAGDGQTVLGSVADRVAADDRDTRLRRDLRRPPDLGQHLAAEPLEGEATRFSAVSGRAHRVEVGERVRGGDPAEVARSSTIGVKKSTVWTSAVLGERYTPASS
jgi:hypothetical protein